MDTPRSPDERPGEDPGDGGWREPSHLGRDGRDAHEERTDDGTDGGTDGGPGSGASAADLPDPDGWPGGTPQPGAPGGATPGGPGRRNPVLEAFAHRGDPWGVQAWALGVGWEISDGTAPRDAVLAEVLAGSPLRLGKDARPTGVVRGRAGTLELVAFDVVEPVGRRWVPRFGVTAAPLLAPPPYFRLSPARFWKHRTGGLLQLPSGDPEFDTRWTMLVREDSPRLRRLVQDPALRALLLATDDGDEFWFAAGHVAAVRPDGQRPDLVEHHARLLGAVVAALSVLD